MSSVAPAVRRRKNLTASASMDENKLLRLARGEEGPAAAPRASLDTAPQSTEFEGGPPDVLAMKASNSRVSLFDSKSVGMMQKISSQVLEQFNMAPSTILLPVWAITFCGVYLLSNFTFKHFQIHVMIPERVHTLSATKLVEVSQQSSASSARRAHRNRPRPEHQHTSKTIFGPWGEPATLVQCHAQHPHVHGPAAASTEARSLGLCMPPNVRD